MKCGFMENINFKELLEKLSKGEITKSELFIFLQTLDENSGSNEVDEAFREYFDAIVSSDLNDKKNNAK